jgi:hypothetical protein
VIGRASWEVDRGNREVYMAVVVGCREVYMAAVEGCTDVAVARSTHMEWEWVVAEVVLPQTADLDGEGQH